MLLMSRGEEVKNVKMSKNGGGFQEIGANFMSPVQCNSMANSPVKQN